MTHLMSLIKSTMKKNNYYDWQRVFSYNALFNFSITERGLGKTYGFLISRIRQTYYTHRKTIMLTKFQNELEGKHSYQQSVFSTIVNDIMLNDEVDLPKDKLEFTLEQNHIYLNGEVCISFYAISMAEKVRKITALKEYDFLAHDEAITFGHYIKNEIDKLLIIYDTMNRRKPIDKSVKLYLLGNAITKYNPYFEYFGFNELKKGYNYIHDTRWLIHISDEKEYALERSTSAISLLAREDSKYIKMASENAFIYDESDFVAPNIKDFTKHYFKLFLNESTYTFSKINNGYYLHTKKNAQAIYHVMKPNEQSTKLSRVRFINIKKAYHQGLLYFENIKIKIDFEKDFFRGF